MSIITYPLNGVTYDAEDVSTYLCTRTSGVYAKDSNYAVSVTGARQITVAPGLAWINYDDFKGVSACSREAVALTIPDADSTLPRIDRVVLQFDTAANLTAVKLKPGTPAAAPEPPAILQNHNQYELGLCTVSVPAGSSVITAADITDTRADEDVCGVMRDGVTGIPTAQLQAQALAIMTQLSTELHTKLDALDAAIAAEPSLKRVICASGDKFVDDPAKKRALHADFNADICEMEAAAILLTCNRNRVPCLMIKAVSDAIEGGCEEFTAQVDRSAAICLEVAHRVIEKLHS